MVDPNRNKQINQKLHRYYQENNDEFVALHNKYFTHEKLPRINEFGIIDEELYDADNGILVVGKETNGWDDEDFAAGCLFRTWLQDITQNGLPQHLQPDGKKPHITRHPLMWYNLELWVSYCDQIIQSGNMNIDYEHAMGERKKGFVTGLGKCAFTNVNKGRGFEASRNEFWELVQHNDLPKQMIFEEINIIQPKIVILCGVACLFAGHVKNDSNRKYIEMPHPGARKKTNDLLEQMKKQFM